MPKQREIKRDVDELYQCETCPTRVAYRSELDEWGRCEKCLLEAEEEIQHEQRLKPWHESRLL